MTDLTSLIEKLEKAEGPDRWLDAKIDAALRIGSIKMQGDGSGYDWAWEKFPVWAHHTQARGMCGVRHESGDLGLVWDSQPFTSSIDAAVSLAERVLPGWDWGTQSFGEDGAHGRVWKHGWHDDTVVRADHSSPVIALVLATLRALQSQGEA